MLSVIEEIRHKDNRAELILEYYKDPEKTLESFLKESGISKKEYREMIVEYRLPTKEEYVLECEIDYIWDKTEVPARDIAESMGISDVKARVYQRAIQKAKGERELTQEERNYMGQYERGKTIPEIAKEKGVSKTKVQKVLQGVDLRYKIDNQKLIKLRDKGYHEVYNAALGETRSKQEIIRRLGLKPTDAWVVGILEKIEGTKGLKYRDVWTREGEVREKYKLGSTIQEIADNTGIGKRTVNLMVQGITRGVTEEKKYRIAMAYDNQQKNITNLSDQELIRRLLTKHGRKLLVQSLKEYSAYWGEYEESVYKTENRIV